MADDELVTDGSTAIRRVQHDLHRHVHAVDQFDLHGSFTMRASDSSHRRLDSFLQSRLELLVGAVGRCVSRFA